ncbi:MAG TPA: sialidase family protein [Candidatus Thermoplasmatota archaeon]|nr:sialidase family protein [Candidatus Thermoplasmatota archaeon]
MRLVAAFLIFIVGVAGCLADKTGALPEPSAPGGPSPRLAQLGPLPSGCDGNRTAVAHHAGGEPAHADLVEAPIPCLVATGHNSMEPTIGIDRDGNLFTYPADVVLYPSLREVPSGVGTMRSSDDGATWDLLVPRIGPVPTHPATEDPYLYLDPATGRLFVEDLLPAFNCGGLSFSDDGGATWTHTVAGCTAFDHQSMAAGPPVTSTTRGYPNVVYRCAINLVALAGASSSSTCQKSLDGGMTWLHAGEPAFQYPLLPPGPPVPSQTCAGAHGHIVVDARGWLYMPRGYCGQPWLAVSKDEAATWTRMQVADLGMLFDETGLEDHEGDVGVDPAGNLYYTWVARDRLPYLVTSGDGGATWSAPRMIGMPGVVEAALPQLAVGGVGKIAFVSMQSQDSPGPPWPVCDLPPQCPVPGPARGYGSVSWNGVLTVSWDALGENATFWSAALDPPGDPLVRGHCGPLRCSAVYDFLDVRIGPDGTAWASLVDACPPGCTLSPQGEGVSGQGQGVVGRFWAGASLWDASDPNGPYP